MYYQKSYAHLTGEQKITEALKDCKVFLGAKRYHEVLRQMKGAKKSFAVGCLGMAGIEGYPAEMMWQRAQEDLAAERQADHEEQILSASQGW